MVVAVSEVSNTFNVALRMSKQLIGQSQGVLKSGCAESEVIDIDAVIGTHRSQVNSSMAFSACLMGQVSLPLAPVHESFYSPTYSVLSQSQCSYYIYLDGLSNQLTLHVHTCTYIYMDVAQCWCLGAAAVVSQQRIVFNTAVLPLRDVFCIVRRHTQTT